MIYSFQGLRALVALAVVFQHASRLTGYAEQSNNFGICILFMMSGFLLVSHRPQNRRVFFMDKLARLAPMNILCLSLMCLLALRDLPGSLTRLVPDLLMLQSWIPDRSFYFSGDPVGWFLSSILFCYFMFPLLRRLLENNPRLFAVGWLAAVSLFVVVVQIFAGSRLTDFVYVAPYSRIFDFSLGMIVGRMCGSGLRYNVDRMQLIAFLVSCVMFICSVYVPEVLYLSFWWFIPSALLLSSLSMGKDGILARALSVRPLVWLGNISFAVFMIHIPLMRVIEILARKNDVILGLWSTVAIVALTSIAAGYVISRYFEKPVTKYLRSRI